MVPRQAVCAIESGIRVVDTHGPREYTENQIHFLSMPIEEQLLTNVAEEGPDVGSEQSEEKQKVEEKRRKYMNPEESAGLINVALIFLGDASEPNDPLLQMLDTLFANTDPEERIRKLKEDFHIPMVDAVMKEVKACMGLQQR